ncbi:Uncharacterised protein [Mycobacteroides abscessus]|nr:Uncharacterised protein [Mycobacteroides abscessus]
MIILMQNRTNKIAAFLKFWPRRLFLKTNAQTVLAIFIQNCCPNQMLFIQHVLHGVVSLVILPWIQVQDIQGIF